MGKLEVHKMEAAVEKIRKKKGKETAPRGWSDFQEKPGKEARGKKEDRRINLHPEKKRSNKKRGRAGEMSHLKPSRSGETRGGGPGICLAKRSRRTLRKRGPLKLEIPSTGGESLFKGKKKKEW